MKYGVICEALYDVGEDQLGLIEILIDSRILLACLLELRSALDYLVSSRLVWSRLLFTRYTLRYMVRVRDRCLDSLPFTKCARQNTKLKRWLGYDGL